MERRLGLGAKEGDTRGRVTHGGGSHTGQGDTPVDVNRSPGGGERGEEDI